MRKTTKRPVRKLFLSFVSKLIANIVVVTRQFSDILTKNIVSTEALLLQLLQSQPNRRRRHAELPRQFVRRRNLDRPVPRTVVDRHHPEPDLLHLQKHFFRFIPHIPSFFANHFLSIGEHKKNRYFTLLHSIRAKTKGFPKGDRESIRARRPCRRFIYRFGNPPPIHLPGKIGGSVLFHGIVLDIRSIPTYFRLSVPSPECSRTMSRNSCGLP